ncbi:DUF3408 domain-containing protein [Limibacterium fermenti]|uniref:DUF3408 domain-containing protein n=1 Tax=Limibacterium fermenti TaxID=3229863 RepID=UPI003A771DA4
METKESCTQGNAAQEAPAPKYTPDQLATLYPEIFLKRNELKNRQSVYVSKDVHTAITRLVHVFALDGVEISVGGFIDNILANHMDIFREHLTSLQKKLLEELR